jgi:DUF971 family protein
MPSADATTPSELRKIGQERFRIAWRDGHASEYTFRYLRQNCPCAACRNEWTGVRTLEPESVAADIACAKVSIVGNYALHFAFSDHHETGIYSFQALREICPCPDCSARKA